MKKTPALVELEWEDPWVPADQTFRFLKRRQSLSNI